ncbi:C1 family peptidase [Deinococcus sonorensis]|uniref:C1 family peptidase n=2 Tax=Deinococcus sonorensis TaxID=309891 RepID=A0AAU7U4D2_9DEIO
MKRLWSSTLGATLLSVLVACSSGTAPPPPTLYTEKNAWSGAIPGDAQTVSADEFSRGIATGELQLISSADLAAQKAAREAQYQQDLAFLRGLQNPSPAVQRLLDQATAHPTFEGDRPVKVPGGQTVLLFGLGTQLHNAAETARLAGNVDNALTQYRLLYDLLPETLKAQAPTPDSLKGKGMAEVRAALDTLNTLLGTAPASGTLGAARLEPNGGLQPLAITPGNGTDNNGPCAPTNLVKRYWFPLKNFVSSIKNQANRGTCWDFSAIGAVESRERVQNNNPADLSEQFLANKVKQDWDASDYVDGYSSVSALNTAVDKGQQLPSEAGWTYNGAMNRPYVKDGDSGSYANTCKGYTGTCSETAHESRRTCTTVIFTFCSYVKVTFGGPGVAASRPVLVWANGNKDTPWNLNSLRLLLAQGHVLIASFPVYKGFRDDVTGDGVVSNYKKTMIDDKSKEVEGDYGGHVVQIVGFLSNEDLTAFGTTPKIGGGGYFIVKNSWGCKNGDGGYYYVPADYVSGLFSDLYTLDFDSRRSDAWTKEQATPGGSQAPAIELKSNPARADLRVETDLAAFFRVTHPVAKSVTLRVSSDVDGVLYNGPWSTDTGALFGPTLKRTFATPGSRTLSLLASYGTGQAQASLSVNVVNSPPTLTLNASGDAHQNEAYPVTALVADPNETDAAALCARTTWSVDAPDTLPATTGCSQPITFRTLGARQVRVTTVDLEGLSASRTLTVNVLPPSVNPYPRIVSSGVYSRQFITIGNFPFCGSPAVAPGNTIDLREKGCTLVSSQPDPTRYFGSVEVENPSGEALTYDWTLYVTDNRGEVPLYRTVASTNTFQLYPYANAIDVTNPCRVAVTVNAPDPARSKTQTVWSGRCTYYSTRLN